MVAHCVNTSFQLEQDLAKMRSPGLLNSVAAVAFHFCLDLLERFSQPGVHFFAQPNECKSYLLPVYVESAAGAAEDLVAPLALGEGVGDALLVVRLGSNSIEI